MTKKIITSVAASGLLLFAGMVGSAAAQTTTTLAPAAVVAPMSVSIHQNGRGTLIGTVASVSGSNVTVNSWGGVWTIDTTNARFLRRYGAKGSLSDLEAGDKVTVQGMFASGGLSVTATIVRDDSVQARNVSPTGTISALNSTAGSFTLTTTGGKAYQITTTTTTRISLNAGLAALSDLQNGMRATVWGVLDRTESDIVARRIAARIPRPVVSASVTASTTMTH